MMIIPSVFTKIFLTIVKSTAYFKFKLRWLNAASH